MSHTTVAATATAFLSTEKPEASSVDQLKAEYQTQLDELSEYFNTNATKPLAWRLKQLKSLKRVWKKYENEVIDALMADLGRPRQMSFVYEIANVQNEIDLMIKKTSSWMKAKKVGTGMIPWPAKTYVRYEPKGVILTIGPWNFPFVLTLIPIANMIAAGNCVVLKPSEVSVKCAEVLTKIVEEALPRNAFRVINGAIPETTALLKLPWDHIMYTGNGMVGRIVMRAAAEHLCPVTLELGGKSPVFIDQSANLDLTVNRLLYGKVTCTGQICIAPDYVMLHEKIAKKFMDKFVAAAKKRFGDKVGNFPDQGLIVNQRHWDRINGMMENHGGEVVFGGRDFADRDRRYFPLTVVYKPDLDSKIMTEEIFGPLLPIFPVKNHLEAQQFIKSREKPLALYVFGNDRVMNSFIGNTSSGAVTTNDVLYHAISQTIPFGGVGPSGMGGYKGFDGFIEYSHKKGIMKRGKTDVAKLRPWEENGPFLFGLIRKLLKFGMA